jgi:N-acetylneuraminate synthase
LFRRGSFPMQLENNNHPSGRIPEVRLGSKVVGNGKPCYVIAEIGINHNGDIDIAKKLISVAVGAGCDAVKFQKRTVDVVYTAEELAKPRESLFGNTNGDLKRGLEFELEEYQEIDRYCREVKIDWLASCWDEASVDVIAQFKVHASKSLLRPLRTTIFFATHGPSASRLSSPQV